MNKVLRSRVTVCFELPGVLSVYDYLLVITHVNTTFTLKIILIWKIMTFIPYFYKHYTVFKVLTAYKLLIMEM